MSPALAILLCLIKKCGPRGFFKKGGKNSNKNCKGTLGENQTFELPDSKEKKQKYQTDSFSSELLIYLYAFLYLVALSVFATNKTLLRCYLCFFICLCSVSLLLCHNDCETIFQEKIPEKPDINLFISFMVKTS